MKQVFRGALAGTKGKFESGPGKNINRAVSGVVEAQPSREAGCALWGGLDGRPPRTTLHAETNTLTGVFESYSRGLSRPQFGAACTNTTNI